MQVFTETLQPNGAKLTAYLLDGSPEMPNISARPAVLVLPGGGFRMCSDREAEPIALAYLHQGYNAFVLRYTVGQGGILDKAMDDCTGALKYLRHHADRFGIDPQRIAAVGFSAGGYMAAYLGTISEEKTNALILGYPVILGYMGAAVGEETPSLDEYVTEQTPPTFLFSTQEDSIVPIENTVLFSAALAKKGVPFESHVFVTGDHGLSIATEVTCSGHARQVNPDVAQWVALSHRFLVHVFGTFPAEGAPWKLVVQKAPLDQPLRMLHKSPAAWAVLCRAIPLLTQVDIGSAMFMGMSINQLAGYSPEMFPQELMATLEVDLKAVL